MNWNIDRALDVSSRVFANPSPRYALRWILRRLLQVLNIMRLHRMPNNPCLRRFDGDLSLRMFPNDHITHRVWYGGYFEYNEEFFLRARIKPGMTVIDAGANVGIHTLLAAKRVGQDGRVHSFEPVGPTHELLLENVRVNNFEDRVILNKMALTDCSGNVVRMEVCRTNSGLAHLRPTGGVASGGWDEFVEDVPTITLDNYLARHGIQLIDFLKIDIEGAECLFLKGARELFAKNPPDVLCEFNNDALARFGSSVFELWEALIAYGYTFFAYNHRQRRLHKCSTIDPTRNCTLVGTTQAENLAVLIGAALVD